MTENADTPCPAADPETESVETFPGWAIVELMGHRRRAGWVSEESRFGTALLRIDIPDGDAPLSEASQGTQYYGGAAIYAVTPCTEEAARHLAGSSQRLPPAHRVALPYTADHDFEEEYD